MPGSSIPLLLGRRIRTLRRLRQWTQEGLAERAHLSGKFVGLVERAAGNPTLDVLVRIAEALQVEIAELFRFEEFVGHSDQDVHDARLVAERMCRYFVGRSPREVGRAVRVVEAALDLPRSARRRQGKT